MRVNGMAFTARAAGPVEGRAVLMLHGFPQTSWSWRFQLASAAQAGYRALAPDQRGYSPGARPKGLERYRMRELVSDVMGFVEWMGTDRVDLVGHDWGGAVAWQVAGTHPELVRTLTVVSTPHPRAFAEALSQARGDQRTRSSYMEFFRQPDLPEQTLLADKGGGLRAMFSASGWSDEDEVDPYIEALSEPGAMTAALNWYRAASIGDMGELSPITIPTLYVWSTEDVALGREAAMATGGWVRGEYRFEVLEGVSHWIPEQASGQLSKLMLEHLGSHS